MAMFEVKGRKEYLVTTLEDSIHTVACYKSHKGISRTKLKPEDFIAIRMMDNVELAEALKGVYSKRGLKRKIAEAKEDAERKLKEVEELISYL